MSHFITLVFTKENEENVESLLEIGLPQSHWL